MREIKFRQPIFSKGIFKEFHYWGIGIEQGGELSNVGYMTFSLDVTNPKDSQQYTGLKDKNGKEIYEGDYVKWTYGKHYWEAIIQTVHNNKSNTLYAIETYHNCTSSEDETTYTFDRSDSRKGSRNDIEYISSNIEVIGNIYENPELLNND